MLYEKTANGFGLMGDLGIVKSKIERNVRFVAGTLHNLRVAAQTGDIKDIPPAELVKLLTEALDALDQVST